jgi:hypothetical protein
MEQESSDVEPMHASPFRATCYHYRYLPQSAPSLGLIDSTSISVISFFYIINVPKSLPCYLKL